MASFNELKLSPGIMKGIAEMGFKEPTPIQAEAIPLLFQGEDVISQAKTGTGKTAAFGIYILEGLDYALMKPQVLILTPTRELCVQVGNEIAEIGKYTGAKIAAVYGGQDIEKQFRLFKDGAQVIVGTPGRVIDHLKRGSLRFDNVGLVVIDEADRLLDMGFIDDVEFILANTPQGRQTLLFSATMPREIRDLAEKYMHTPQFVKVSSDDTPVVMHIGQSFIAIPDARDRLYGLLRYLDEQKPRLAMIFTRTKFGADKLGTILRERDYRVEMLHGDLSQKKRDWVMEKFRSGKVQILVATDLAARGLDIDDVTHVINYNMPEDHLTYVHRVGRTGRMGKAGDAMTLVLQEEMGKLGDIERALSVRMKEVRYEFRKREPSEKRYEQKGRRSTFRRDTHQRAPVPHTYNL